MDFASRLKTIRKDHSMTQQELADKSGLSRSSINTWESGRSLPLPDGLCALANALGCSTDYLLGREQEDGLIVIDNSSNAISDIEQHILDVFRALTNRNKIKVVGYVDGIYAGQSQGA